MFEGWFGERKTQFNLWFSLNKELYRRFHDVIIPSSNGTTQVDHILVSPFGLFIVETKNLKGWIFGSESQSKWTQVVYGKKYSFQNPLRQTHRHKKVLSKFLDLNESHIQTVVYFNGDSEFKTELPSNVLSSGLGSYIKQFNDTVLSDTEVQRVCGSDLVERTVKETGSKFLGCSSYPKCKFSKDIQVSYEKGNSFNIWIVILVVIVLIGLLSN